MSEDPGFSVSTGISWMFQSERVSNEMLTEALVELYFEPLYRCCQLITGDYRHAGASQGFQAVVENGVTKAVKDRYRYWGDLQPLSWLLELLFIELGFTEKRSFKFTTRKKIPQKNIRLLTVYLHYVHLIPVIFDPSDSWYKGQPVDNRGITQSLVIDSNPPTWLELRQASDEKIHPPPNFNLNTAPLSIVWDGDWYQMIAPGHGNRPTTGTGNSQNVGIYAGDYYLGDIQIAADQIISCSRSPDGKIVLQTGYSGEFSPAGSPIFWFSLDQLDELHPIDESIVASYFAFSPDGGKLVSTGCPHAMGCGLVVYDLETGEDELLLPMTRRFNLTQIAWGEDGQYVAIRGFEFDSMDNTCITKVVRVEDGEIVFTGEPGSCGTSGEALSQWGIEMSLATQSDGCRVP